MDSRTLVKIIAISVFFSVVMRAMEMESEDQDTPALSFEDVTFRDVNFHPAKTRHICFEGAVLENVIFYNPTKKSDKTMIEKALALCIMIMENIGLYEEEIDEWLTPPPPRAWPPESSTRGY